MSGPSILCGSVTAAERLFYAEAMGAVSTVGGHMVASARHHSDGTAEVLTRRDGTWITLDSGTMRTAPTALGQVQPGLTIACDHGYRVDKLIAALAHNSEADYDDCLIDGLLQIAILGTVTYDSPAGGE